MPTLLLMNEAGESRRVPLTEAQTKVGRSTANHLVLESRRVSRQHAVLLQQGSFVTLRDLGSTNGSFVNGERVTVTSLFDGDTIRFGEVELRYLDSADAEAEIQEMPLWIMNSPAPEEEVASGDVADVPAPAHDDTYQSPLDHAPADYGQISQVPVGGTRGAAWIGEALAFTFAAQGRPINALITYEALADHFGDGVLSIDSESRAVEAYQRHSMAIHVAASLRYEEVPREPVLLRTTHF